MIKMSMKVTVKLPDDILVRDDLINIANKIFIPLLRAHIEKGMSVDGSELPKPEPSTIKKANRKIEKSIFTKKGDIRKRALVQIEKTGLTGFSKKVLIDTGKLVSSFYAKKKGKNSVVVTLRSNRKTIGKYLQIDGIKSRSGLKFYKFFGISEGMEMDAVDYMKEKIKEKTREFNG